MYEISDLTSVCIYGLLEDGRKIEIRYDAPYDTSVNITEEEKPYYFCTEHKTIIEFSTFVKPTVIVNKSYSELDDIEFDEEDLNVILVG